MHEAPERGGVSPILSLGWTLNYEIYFYIVFALLAFLSVTARVGVLTVLFGALWAAGLLLSPENPVLQFYLNASPVMFVIGAWIGRRYLAGGFATGTGRVWPFALMSALGAALTLVDDGTLMMSQLSFAGQALWATGLLLAGLMLEPRIGRSKLFEQLGDASYALYLSHIFVIGAVAYVARRIVGQDHPATVLLISLVSIVVACMASLVIHRMIEKPILRVLNGRRKTRHQLLPESLPAAH